MEELIPRREGTKRSDHQLLMAMLTIKLRKTKIGEDRVIKIDAAKLGNRFQEETVEPDFCNFHQTVRIAGERTYGFRKGGKKNGYSKEHGTRS